ncbi:hypothetical protein ACHAXR_005089 [Thalassiosira sp. AJA248-18]
MSQAEFKRRLKALMLRPENQVCSDCPERQPRWASLVVPPPGAPPGSLPMGVFCCLECSGSHRRLGVHISFVRSINLDSWKEKEVVAMENGGNGKVNAIFEARLSVAKPTNSASGQVRERFIRDKYERRKFYDPAAFGRVSQMENERAQEKVVSGVQRRLASGSRKPSDAARKRVEERASRNRSGGGGGGVRSPTSSARAPPPAPVAAPPAPVVDLLDFGDFNSPEAASAVQASVVGVTSTAPVPVPATTSNNEPQLDLFANMSVGNTPGVGGGETNGGQMPQQPGQPQQSTPSAAEQRKMSNSDILSMFNAPTAQHNPMQQNMFAMGGGGVGGGGMPNGMAGGNNMAMMGGQMNNMNPQQMGMMNNNMNPQQQMGMMNPNMMAQGQMMQMNNMMGQQGNNMGNMGGMNNMGNNMGGNMNMGMMQQQGQMPQMNNMAMAGQGMGANSSMMMMQGGVGMMQQGGNQFGQSPMGGQAMQQQGQQPSAQQQGNQFEDFGNFGR